MLIFSFFLSVFAFNLPLTIHATDLKPCQKLENIEKTSSIEDSSKLDNHLNSKQDLYRCFAKGTKAKFFCRLTPDITSDEFSTIKHSLENLGIYRAIGLQDKDLQNLKGIKELRLYSMTHLTNETFTGLNHVSFLLLSNCPNIDITGILSLKSLKNLYLWNMPHITDHELRLIRQRKIKVIDGRFRNWESTKWGSFRKILFG